MYCKYSGTPKIDIHIKNETVYLYVCSSLRSKAVYYWWSLKAFFFLCLHLPMQRSRQKSSSLSILSSLLFSHSGQGQRHHRLMSWIRLLQSCLICTCIMSQIHNGISRCLWFWWLCYKCQWLEPTWKLRSAEELSICSTECCDAGTDVLQQNWSSWKNTMASCTVLERNCMLQ